MPTEDIQHPGTILVERYLNPLGVTPTHLARSIGVPEHEISELAAGRRAIDPDFAARLALFFNVPPRWWLIHQARYDAEHLAPMAALKHAVTPYEGLSDVLVTPQGVKILAPEEAEALETPKAKFSEGFVTRLRAQVKWLEDSPRTVSETQLPDGNVALVGE